jgi:hypothetical protein
VADQLRLETFPSRFSSPDLSSGTHSDGTKHSKLQRRKGAPHGHKKAGHTADHEAVAASSNAEQHNSSLLKWMTDSSTADSKGGPKARRAAKAIKRATKAEARLESTAQKLFSMMPLQLSNPHKAIGADATAAPISSSSSTPQNDSSSPSPISSVVDAGEAILQWAQEHEARYIDAYSAADGTFGMHLKKPRPCSQSQVSQIKCYLDAEGYITGLAVEDEAGITAPALCDEGVHEDGGVLEQGEAIVEIVSCK